MDYALLNEGLTLYCDGQYYEAHELWEYAWGDEVGRNKLMLQALILIAAGLHKFTVEKNRRGPSKLLAKARDKISDVREGGSAWFGIDLVALAAGVDHSLAAADAFARDDSVEVPAPTLPQVTGRDGVIYLHGFASGPSSFKASVVVPPLREHGLSVAVPDLNEGDFEHLTISRALATAKRLLRERTVVIGSSFGGYVASLLAASDDRVKGLVLMAPAFDMASRMRKRYGEPAIEAWRRAGTTKVEHYAFGGEHPIAYGFLDDAETHAPYPQVRAPTYVLQGERDDVVTPDTVRGFVEAHPELVELDLVADDHGLGESAQKALFGAQRMIERLGLEPTPPPATMEAAQRRLAAIEQEPPSG